MNFTPEQEQMWNRIVQSFRDSLPAVSFNAWIKPMKLYAVTSDEVIVTFKDMAAQFMIVSRYQSRVETVVRTVFGMRYSFKILDERDVERQLELNSETMLNPKYTFDNFVVGPSNNLAYVASLAVAEMPSETYNPLFLYGDVGLGKTHLMNAIGNFIVKQNPMASILFTTSERFASELIDAIIKKKGT